MEVTLRLVGCGCGDEGNIEHFQYRFRNIATGLGKGAALYPDWRSWECNACDGLNKIEIVGALCKEED